MIPFAEHVRFEADTGEVEFKESSDLSIAVAERGAAVHWARADRLTCVRVAGDSMEPTDGTFVVVDKDRRVAVDERSSCASATRWWSSAFGRSATSGTLVSDSLAYLPRAVTADDRIVGRVAWCGPHSAGVA